MPAAYAELHCLTNSTFLRGASSAQELFECASKLGYEALAICDECSMAGIVQAWEAAQQYKLKLIVGSEIQLDDGPELVILACNYAGYTQLCQLISKGRCRSKKGEYSLCQKDLETGLGDCLVLLRSLDPQHAQWLGKFFPGRCWLTLHIDFSKDAKQQLQLAQALADNSHLPLVASGNVHMHSRSRRPLQDTLTAIRLNKTLDQLGFDLHANGEHHLRSRQRLEKIYPPALLQDSTRIAALCDFRLDQISYQYPAEVAPGHLSTKDYLRQVTEQGIRLRWPAGETAAVRQQIEHELKLISELRYESYFLTVYDIVRFARSQNILCQGRGSAANSAVCYCLQITEVDPARMNMLFERFISKERNEPPDIDVDFEHQRREEVIQYIYKKYGRDRAALAATVITYRPKSAIRDVGRALGFSLEQTDRMAKAMSWWDKRELMASRLQEQGFDPDSPMLVKLCYLVEQILGFPRHLSQHVGGFIIADKPLSSLVPIENAAMPDRTIIQWDKNDLESLGLLKIDVLALGMLSAIRRCLKQINDFYATAWSLANIPAEDPKVYAMIQKADTIGVFQIESRAQMSMLPRLKPACFYDLVIEVAIVRPGPIQGNMVHPYLRRRQGLEKVEYPNKALEAVLDRTLGIPIFQEQVMQVAMVAAGFSPGEADQLRRSMAAWKRRGGMEHFEQRLTQGMLERGYTAEFSEQIFNQIKGFGEYGFPESHSASFALLVYVSAWLKCHYPAAFSCALLNSLPMGFYSASQLTQDLKRHQVEIRPIDVCHSDWLCSLEVDKKDNACLRLGLNRIKGLSEKAALSIETARQKAPFVDLQDLFQRTALNKKAQRLLVNAGALRTLSGHRHRASWAVQGYENFPPLLQNTRIAEQTVSLPPPTEAKNMLADYASTGLTLNRHPLALVRSQLRTQGVCSTREASTAEHGSFRKVAGLVTLRQRPGSASGVTFITLEDETGMLNVIVWQQLAREQRRTLLESELIVVDGILEREGLVCHLIAKRLHNFSHLVESLKVQSRDFC